MVAVARRNEVGAIRFTDAAVKKVQVGKGKLKNVRGRFEIADAIMPGLYLVVQASGKKSWALRFRLNGKLRKFTMGAYPIIKTDEAREQARDALIAARKDGVDPQAERRKAKIAAAALANTISANTVEDAVQKYIKSYCRPNNRSWRGTALRLGLRPDPDNEDRFIKTGKGIVKDWGAQAIKSITDADVLARLDAIKATGPQSVNQEFAFLRGFFRWCVSKKLTAVNPCAGIIRKDHKDVLRPPVSRDRVLTDDELKQVWLAAEGLGPPFGPFIHTLILTGQRRNEVAGMRWGEIDKAARTWTLPKERRKSRSDKAKPHDVPLSDDALTTLAKLPPHIGSKRFVFTTTGDAPISGFSKAKKQLDKTMRGNGEELARWTLHDLRRTLATGLQKLGVRLEVTEAVLGHTSGSRSGVVGIYQRHDWAPEKRDALDRWARHMMALVTDTPEHGNVVQLMDHRA